MNSRESRLNLSNDLGNIGCLDLSFKRLISNLITGKSEELKRVYTNDFNNIAKLSESEKIERYGTGWKEDYNAAKSIIERNEEDLKKYKRLIDKTPTCYL